MAETRPVGSLHDYMSRLLAGDPEVATGGPADCFRVIADLRPMARCRPTTSKRELLRNGRPVDVPLRLLL